MQCIAACEDSELWSSDISNSQCVRASEETEQLEQLWDMDVTNSQCACSLDQFETSELWSSNISDAQCVSVLESYEDSVISEHCGMSDRELVSTVTEIESAVFDLGFDIDALEEQSQVVQTLCPRCVFVCFVFFCSG